jgi:hypothetical protein
LWSTGRRERKRDWGNAESYKEDIVSKVIAVVLFLLLSAGAAFSQTAGNASDPQKNRDLQGESRGRHRGRPGQPSGQIAAVQTVCANEVPHGWIRTNDRWDPTICGKPTTMVYNVWTIEQYRGRPLASIMRVCSGQVPRGWVMTDATWNPTMCGHPTAMMKNVMTIKRIE